MHEKQKKMEDDFVANKVWAIRSSPFQTTNQFHSLEHKISLSKVDWTNSIKISLSVVHTTPLCHLYRHRECDRETRKITTKLLFFFLPKSRQSGVCLFSDEGLTSDSLATSHLSWMFQIPPNITPDNHRPKGPVRGCTVRHSVVETGNWNALAVRRGTPSFTSRKMPERGERAERGERERGRYVFISLIYP